MNNGKNLSTLKSANGVHIHASRSNSLTPNPDRNEFNDVRTVAFSWKNNRKEDVVRLAGELLRLATSKEFSNNPKAQINLTGYRFTGRSVKDGSFNITATIDDRL